MEAKKNPEHDVHRQSGKFFLIGLALSVTLAITAFEWRSEKTDYAFDYSEAPVDEVVFQLKPEVTLFRVEQPAATPTLQPVVKTNVNLTETTEATSNTPTVLPFDEPVFPIGIDSALLARESTPEILLLPEVAPVPEGGIQAFYSFVGKNMKYPKRARQTQTQGRVFIEFVVDKSGQVTDMKVIKGIGSGCDEEAMRVLALTKWHPGRQRGNPVKVRMTIPLNFVLK